jgi:hypothetical protein
MQGNKIKLPNRYNEEVYLEKIEDTKYRLVHRSYYVRLGTIDGVKDKYTFIDISGGPMISLKDKLSIGVVKSISKDNDNYIIEVER